MDQDLLALTGTHNLYNSLASGIASKVVDIHDENIRASLVTLPGWNTAWKVARVARSRLYQRFESNKRKLLLVCLAKYDYQAGTDTGRDG